MKPQANSARYFLVLAICFYCSPTLSELARIAIASNFSSAARALKQDFERSTRQALILIPGSSGKHFAQITHGAPFDAFLSADSRRPQRLEAGQYGISGSRFTYARGRLVLWSSQKSFEPLGATALSNGALKHLAIANPSLAPYGRAAKETLQSLGQWDTIQPLLVRGENIAQTFQFVHSQHAELGLVAQAQVHSSDLTGWLVPARLHTPIIQQAILLTDNETARLFLTFLKSKKAKRIINSYGYETEPDN